MAASRLRNTPLQHYQRQRDRVIWLTFVSFFIIIIFGVVSFFILPEEEYLQTILFFLLIGFLGWVLYAKQAMVTINMYYHYHRMIHEQCPPFIVNISPSTSAFQEQLESQGYLIGVDRPLYRIHYQVFNSLPFVKRTAMSMVSIIQLKDALSFYDDRIEEDLMLITANLKLKNTHRITNDLRFIFKSFTTLDEETKDTYHRIINLHVQNRALITLPVGYHQPTKSVYVLRPLKQYPHKFYYAAIQLIYQLTKAQL